MYLNVMKDIECTENVSLLIVPRAWSM